MNRNFKSILRVIRIILLVPIFFLIYFDTRYQFRTNKKYAKKYLSLVRTSKDLNFFAIYLGKLLLKHFNDDSEIKKECAKILFDSRKVIDSLSLYSSIEQKHDPSIALEKANLHLLYGDIDESYLQFKDFLHNNNYEYKKLDNFAHTHASLLSNPTFVISKKIKKNYLKKFIFQKKNIEVETSKIHIGFFCSFLNSPGFSTFILPIINSLISRGIKITIIGKQETRKISSMYNFKSISFLDMTKTRKLIRSLNLNILIDIDGFESPILKLENLNCIRAVYWNYPHTTANPQIDYYIGDTYCTPKIFDKYYSERIIRLRCPAIVFKFRYNEKNLNNIKHSTSKIIFGYFGNPEKLNDTLLNAWSKIFNKTKSKLLLNHHLFASSQVRKILINRFKKFGVSKNKIIFENGYKNHEKAKTYSKIDIFLDPFPHTGGHTAMECLIYGVPYISMSKRGITFAQRHSGSFLYNIGYKKLIAKNINDYIKKNIELALNKSYFLKVKKQFPVLISSSSHCNFDFIGTSWEQAIKSMIQKKKNFN